MTELGRIDPAVQPSEAMASASARSVCAWAGEITRRSRYERQQQEIAHSSNKRERELYLSVGVDVVAEVTPRLLRLLLGLEVIVVAEVELSQTGQARQQQ